MSLYSCYMAENDRMAWFSILFFWFTHSKTISKNDISTCSTQQHNDLPLAISPLLLFRFRVMMTRPSPSLLLHGAPLVPIDMERWNVRPLLPSLSLSLKGPSDIGWTDKKSDKTHYANNLQYTNFIILQKEKNLSFKIISYTRLCTEWSGIPGLGKRIFSPPNPRLALESIQPLFNRYPRFLFPGIKQPEHEADH